DTHLPRGEAALELFLLPRLARRLVVPAILLVEPVLDPARARREALLAELDFHDVVGELRFGSARCVDEDGVAVTRDREAARCQVLGELARLGVEIPSEPLE